MPQNYYSMCRANIGRVCDISTTDGRRISGRIAGVTPTGVQLTPLGSGISEEKDSNSKTVKGIQAVDSKHTKEGNEVLFFFPFFIPFAAITALAFAAAATPFFGFGFRRPFRRGFRRGFF